VWQSRSTYIALFAAASRQNPMGKPMLAMDYFALFLIYSSTSYSKISTNFQKLCLPHPQVKWSAAIYKQL